jgi:hypothetical protein
MKQYSYLENGRGTVLLRQLQGFLLLFLTAPIYLLVFASLFFVPFSPEDYLALLCIGLGLFLFCISIVSFFVNYYPTIWIDEEGLYLSFFVLFHIKVRWGEVIDVNERQWFLDQAMLVRVKKVMPFHILYSLFYSGSFLPGFLFLKSIQDSSDLIREIRARTRSKEA